MSPVEKTNCERPLGRLGDAAVSFRIALVVNREHHLLVWLTTVEVDCSCTRALSDHSWRWSCTEYRDKLGRQMHNHHRPVTEGKCTAITGNKYIIKHENSVIMPRTQTCSFYIKLSYKVSKFKSREVDVAAGGLEN